MYSGAFGTPFAKPFPAPTKESLTRSPPTTCAGKPSSIFAGWKQHYSLYPATAPVVAALKDELGPYKVNNGTIRFPLTGTVPVKLIERIATLRAKEMADREKMR